jgi:hypothetical protein
VSGEIFGVGATVGMSDSECVAVDINIWGENEVNCSVTEAKHQQFYVAQDTVSCKVFSGGNF